MLDDLRQQIEKNIAAFIRKIRKEYGFHLVHPGLYDAIAEYSLRQGKRIRPILLLLSYKGYAKNHRIPPSLYYTAICVEFLHNFMLIHDDIIDNSDLRRGKPTMHKLLERPLKTSAPQTLGKNLAIIAGDIIYSLAIDAFLKSETEPKRKEKALKYFVQTTAFTAMGEFIDILHGVDKIDNIRERDVFLNYSLKTARYTFECPLVIGATLAGANDKELKKLSQLGLLVGQAFQIQDDVIGIFDTEKNIGKSILSDLAESKKTLLVCRALKTLKGQTRQEFRMIFNKKKKNHKDLKRVQEIFVAAGILEECLQETQIRMKTAWQILDSLTLNQDAKNIIREAISKLFQNSNAIARKYEKFCHPRMF